jgi:DNA-binding transcriptional ArsR family regulator
LTHGAQLAILKSMLNKVALDSAFRAIAEPTRRAILEQLGAGPATVTSLSEPLDMSFAAVVQHVNVLEECGLIRTEKIGRVRTCRIEPAAFAPLAKWIEARRMRVEHSLDRLGAVLDAKYPTAKPKRRSRSR